MFRLALALGRTVSELEATMPSSEMTEWLAYYKLEPFGQERDNWHAALIASILANINRRKNAPATPISEFMYKDRDSRKQAETQGFLAGLKALAKPKKATHGKD